MTLSAALLLQWVRITSPSCMRLAPISPMNFTAFTDDSLNALALAMMRSVVSLTVLQPSAPFSVACTPFQRDTAVGLDPRTLSLATARSLRKASMSSPL